MEEHYQSKFNLTLGLEFAKVKSGKSEDGKMLKWRIQRLSGRWKLRVKL